MKFITVLSGLLLGSAFASDPSDSYREYRDASGSTTVRIEPRSGAITVRTLKAANGQPGRVQVVIPRGKAAPLTFELQARHAQAPTDAETVFFNGEVPISQRPLLSRQSSIGLEIRFPLPGRKRFRSVRVEPAEKGAQP